MGKLKELINNEEDREECDIFEKDTIEHTLIYHEEFEKVENQKVKCPCEYGICSECSYCNIDYNIC